MEMRVPNWVRLGIAATLAAPQLIIGVWAVLAPANWYRTFPGFDPRLIAAEPPFNGHLAGDAGAGFLATGVALAVAAAWAQRSGVRIALIAYVAFAVPHLVYHIAHPAPALTSGQDLLNAATQAVGPMLAALFAWGSGTNTEVRPAAGTPEAQAGERHLGIRSWPEELDPSSARSTPNKGAPT